MEAIFFYKSSCDTCRKALKVVRDLRPGLALRDYTKAPLSRAEIEQILDAAGGVAPALNAYNASVRERGWVAAPPERAAFVEAALTDNNLIRRPVLITAGQVVIGRDEETYRKLLG